MTHSNDDSIRILDLTPEIEALWQELNGAFQRVLASGQFILGPEVEAFEAEIAAYLGVEHAVGVNSGTDALTIALLAAGTGPGDEVITTPFTFFATGESIATAGATPVFVDIREDSFNLDPDAIEPAVGPKTKAIVPVHLYGRPCEIDPIMDVADRHGLTVIEDCAQSFGATSRGRQTGAIGRAGAFSFFPTKNLGGFGDGGLIATDDADLADSARVLRVHGSRKRYENERLGYNSRLDALQAALLRVKLPHVDGWNRQRREAAARYNALFAGLDEVVTPELVDGHVFHQYTVRVPSERRDALRAHLAERGIDTMIYYPIPVDASPVFADGSPAPVSKRLAREVVSLPIGPNLDLAAQTRVAEGVRSFVESLH